LEDADLLLRPPLPGVEDGRSRQPRTNRKGIATFAVTGYGEQQFIAVSGTATVTLIAHWSHAPEQRLTIAARKKRARRGRRPTWTIVATIRDPSGHPVSGQLINFQLYALPGSILNHTRARTDKTGTAHVTVSTPVGGSALIQAVTNHAALAHGVTVSG
jgi:hypothetical protein